MCRLRAWSALFAIALLASGCHRAPGSAGHIRVDSGRVVVAGSSLFYERAGSGPTLVLLHANYVDRRMWDPQFLQLARYYDVIRYDARGLGNSGPARSAYSASTDLYKLLDALNVKRTMLMGSSMGGATAIDFALAHPGMVSRMVLVAPGLSGYRFPPVDLQEPWRVQARAALAADDTTGVAKAWLQSEFLTVARRDSVLAPKIASLLVDNVSLWKGLIEDQRAWDSVPEPPALPRLPSLSCPVLIVVGSQDAADMLRIADTLLTKVPHAQHAIVDGADHFPNLEHPALFLELVQRFLAER